MVEYQQAGPTSHPINPGQVITLLWNVECELCRTPAGNLEVT